MKLLDFRFLLLCTIGLSQFGCFITDDFATSPAEIKCQWSKAEDGLCNDPIEIVAGKAHTCIIRGQLNAKTNSAWCWGDNQSGQLGINEDFVLKTANIPKRVYGLNAVSDISAGEQHTCAINAQKLYCWGSNFFGQLGYDPNVNNGYTRKPMQVQGTENETWTRVFAGGKHSCALTTTEELWCWGDSTFGQSGQASDSLPLWRAPQKFDDEDELSHKNVSLGFQHSCSVGSKKVRCWGQSTFGKTLRPVDSNSSQWHQPQNHSFDTSVAGLAVGKEHSCALSDETVFCWGNNEFGQLGNEMGAPVFDYQPLVVAGLSEVKSIAAGNSSTCALLKNGSVSCWGNNESSQLGDNSVTTRHVPDSIGASETEDAILAYQLAVGGEHACIIDKTGQILCWGLNEFGQAGQDATGQDNSTAAGGRRVGGPALVDPPADPDDTSTETTPSPNEEPEFKLVSALCLTRIGTLTATAPNSVTPAEYMIETGTVASPQRIAIEVNSCGNTPVEFRALLENIDPQMGFFQANTATSTIINLAAGETHVFVVEHIILETFSKTQEDELNFINDLVIKDSDDNSLHKIGLTRKYSPSWWVNIYIDSSTVAFDGPQPIEFSMQNPKTFRVESNRVITGFQLMNDVDDDFALTSSTGIGTKTATATLLPDFEFGDLAASLIIEFSDASELSLRLNRSGQTAFGSTFKPTKLASGDNHTCALGEVTDENMQTSQQIQCWGKLWEQTLLRLEPQEPQKVDIDSIEEPFPGWEYRIEDIFAGGDTTCTKSVNTSTASLPMGLSQWPPLIHCWGANNGGVFRTESDADLEFHLQDSSMGGGTVIEIEDIAVDDDGAQFLVGTFTGTISLNGINHTAVNKTGFLIKRTPQNSTNELEWYQLFTHEPATEAAFVPKTLVVDGAHVIVGGNVYSPGGGVLSLPTSPTTGCSSMQSVLNPSNNGFIVRYSKDGQDCALDILRDTGTSTGAESGVFLEDLAIDTSVLPHILYGVGYVHDNANIFGVGYENPEKPNAQDAQRSSGFIFTAYKETASPIALASAPSPAFFYNADQFWGTGVAGPTDKPTKFQSIAILAEASTSTPSVVISGIGAGCLRDVTPPGVPTTLTVDCDVPDSRAKERMYVLTIKRDLTMSTIDSSVRAVQVHEIRPMVGGAPRPGELFDSRVTTDGAAEPKIFVAASGKGTFERNLFLPSSLQYQGHGIYLDTLSYDFASDDFDFGDTDTRRLIEFTNSGTPEIELGDLAYDTHSERVIMVGAYTGAPLDFSPVGGESLDAPMGTDSNTFLAQFNDKLVLQREVLNTSSGSSGDFSARRLAIRNTTSSALTNGIYAAGSFRGTFEFGPGPQRTISSSHPNAMTGADAFVLHFLPRAAGSEVPLLLLGPDNYFNETTDILDFGLGSSHACWLRQTNQNMDEKKLECWGDSSEQKTGDRVGLPYTPKTVSLPDVAEVFDLTVGEQHACAVISAGSNVSPSPDQIRCWGRCVEGQCGYRTVGETNPADSAGERSAVLTSLVDATTTQLGSKASSHTCIMTPEMVGTNVECWGPADCGQLGIAVGTSTTTPIYESHTGSAFAEIQNGKDFSCRIETNTTGMPILMSLRCWGRPDRRGVGDIRTCQDFSFGSFTSEVVETSTADLECVRDLAVGRDHACAIGEAGSNIDCMSNTSDKIYCWGDTSFGQTGTFSRDPKLKAVEVFLLPQ